MMLSADTAFDHVLNSSILIGQMLDTELEVDPICSYRIIFVLGVQLSPA